MNLIETKEIFYRLLYKPPPTPLFSEIKIIHNSLQKSASVHQQKYPK